MKKLKKGLFSMSEEMETLEKDLLKLMNDTLAVVKDVQEVENLCKDHLLELVFDFLCRVCTCTCNRIRNWSEVYQNGN